jgi:hypothetical protein
MGGGSGPNNKGEYRFFGIPAGKYIVTSQCFMPVFEPRPFSSGPDALPTRAYRPQYYPGAYELKSAQVLELDAGVEKTGIDFRMAPAPATQVHVVLSGADWHDASLNAQLWSDDGIPLPGHLNLDKSAIDFTRITPGAYTMSISSNTRVEDRIGSWAKIVVGDRPVETAVELKKAFEISGTLEIDTTGNPNSKISVSQIQVLFRTEQRNRGYSQPAPVSSDGRFTLKGVLPDIWTLEVNGPGVFLRSAWLGSVDVAKGPFEIKGGEGSLRLVASTNMGTIRGTGPPGQGVSCVKDGNRMTMGTVVAPNGQFEMQGIAPGKYRVVLTSSGDFSDDDVPEVTVGEGETVVVALK